MGPALAPHAPLHTQAIAVMSLVGVVDDPLLCAGIRDRRRQSRHDTAQRETRNKSPGNLARGHCIVSRHIGMITLVVRDYDEAIAWYTKVLGFSLVSDTALSDSKRWVVVAPEKDGAPAASGQSRG